jgi:hypothetical protein
MCSLNPNPTLNPKHTLVLLKLDTEDRDLKLYSHGGFQGRCGESWRYVKS